MNQENWEADSREVHSPEGKTHFFFIKVCHGHAKRYLQPSVTVF